MPTVTSPVATDETLQATNTALGNLAKDSTLQTQNGKMDSIITKLQGIIDALGLDTSIYKAAGSKTCAELISSLLIAGNLGNVYNVTDSGTTTSDFVEGAGKPISAGDNVAIVDIGTGGSHTYKFDLLAGMVDISGKADKVSGATNGNLAGLDANGNLTDSGVAKTDIDDMQDELSTDSATATGNPINFTTKTAQNAESTIIDLEPIQDLHGYDKPWVGGAGKNKCPNYTADSYSGTDSNGVTYTKNSDGTISTSGTSTATSFWRESFTFKAGTYIISGGINNNCFFGLYKSGTGYIVTSTDQETAFTLNEDTSLGVTCRIGSGINADGLKFYPMVRLSTEPEGYEPYENICPISGRTEIGILGCGKNLWTIDHIADVSDNTDYELTDTGIRVYSTGSYSYRSVRAYIDDIPQNKTLTFSFSMTETSGQGSVGIQGSINGVDYENISVTAVGNDRIFNSGNYKMLRFQFFCTRGTTTAGNVTYSNLQLEINSNSTSYSPYTLSNDLTISLGQTVYGGTIDVENGVLTVNRAYETFDGSNDETWYLESSGTNNFFYAIISNAKNSSAGGNHISNEFEHIGVGSSNTNIGFWIVDNIRLRVRYKYDNTLTVSDLRTWLSSNNLEVCYELATPITIQLTPNEISLLEGVNNISTTGDKITLTYRDGKVATLGDLTSAVDNLDSKIDESKILTDTATGDKYILVVTNGVLSVQQVSN